jgi:hypothetical protein
MKTKPSRIHPLLTVLAVTLIGWSFAAQSARAHGSEEAMKAFMEPYGKIQVALASDDLPAAQAAAKALPLDKDAQAIAASKNLDDARTAFKSISKKAIGMSADDEGYYVFKCPMVDDGNWVQTSTKCANPYLGKSMPGCGKMLTKEEAMKMADSIPGTHHHE